ncbi:hypothetical protein F5Y04DRAFT_288617 [Hypomontagnella monticulosa]|nr:hypothetical protein F5Y04DRAFT_288617 [Hypomontagnella monticulosa]
MAPIKLNARGNKSNIGELNSHARPIPYSILAPNQPSSISLINRPKSSQPASFSIAEGFKHFAVTMSQPLIPRESHSYSKGLSAGEKAGISIGVLVLITIAGLLTWRWWKKRQAVAHWHQVRNEEPESRELSTLPTQSQQPQDHWVITKPVELPALREPAELHGIPRLPELPGDYRHPGAGRRWYRSKKSLRVINLSRKYISAQKDRRSSRQTV